MQEPDEESKGDNDELCLCEHSEIKEEDIPEEKPELTEFSPIKDEKNAEFYENLNDNEEEKKINEMIDGVDADMKLNEIMIDDNEQMMEKKVIGERMIEEINMEETTNIDMMNAKTMEKKKPQFKAENLELMDFLFSYFDKKDDLINPTTLGYFSKIINALLNKKFDHVLIFFFFKVFYLLLFFEDDDLY